MDPIDRDPTGMDPTSDAASLWPTPPAPIVPVPAARVASLRGQRVIVGSAQTGWRYDLRADDPVDQGGQPMVPVLGEYDYYRAELDHLDMYAPLIPLDQVWVEHVPDNDADHDQAGELADTAAAGGPGSYDAGPGDLFSRLVNPHVPPRRRPVPARDMPALTGRRVVVASPGHVRRDIRVLSEPYEAADRTISLRVCKEPAWYQWAFTGTPPPHPVEAPIFLVWVE